MSKPFTKDNGMYYSISTIDIDDKNKSYQLRLYFGCVKSKTLSDNHGIINNVMNRIKKSYNLESNKLAYFLNFAKLLANYNGENLTVIGLDYAFGKQDLKFAKRTVERFEFLKIKVKYVLHELKIKEKSK